MQIWYSFLDNILPFEWIQYTFMKNALLAVLLITPLLGMLGTMIVNNKMSFFSDALGHSALTGIAIGVILGMKSPLLSMILFSIFLSFAILGVRSQNSLPSDTVIGVFSSTAVALGIVILSRAGGFTKYSSYLVGDILSITPSDIFKLFIVLLITLIFWSFMFNKLLLVSINKSLASSRGVKVFVVESLFTIIIALIVTISIQWVGLLIINSLLILPSAAARNISSNMRQYHIYSISIAVISGIIGLIASYFFGTATGSTIVLILAVFFFATLLFRHKIA